MKNLKKIGALLLALVMLLAMGSTALAAGEANMTNKAGVIGEFTEPDVATVQNRAVIIYKEITAYNPESSTVNAPAITFNYTITSSADLAGKNVIDHSSHHNPAANAHVLTKQGIGTPTITGTGAGVLALSPTVTGDQLKASVNGTANRFPLTISFDGIDFTTGAGTGAGIYRYQIDETTTLAKKNAAGIAEGTGANTLYMDVYVDGTGAIYGYVLFTNNGNIDATTSDSDASTAAGKVEGFVSTEQDEGVYASDTSTADKYYTFNLEISKSVANDAYIQGNHHEFPFHVTLDNSSVTASVLPIMTVGTYATQTALTAGAIGTGTGSNTVWTPTIGHGGKVTYVGIPCGTTVTIYEENDVVGTTYAASVAGADTAVETKNIYFDGTTREASNTATVNCGATALSKATENHTASANKVVAFMNTLLQISPTGVTLRVAPYVLILAAGVVLLALTRRRKHSADEV